MIRSMNGHDEQARLLAEYVAAVSGYHSAVQILAKLSGIQNGAFESAMTAVNGARQKTERARVMLQVYRDNLKTLAVSANG